MTNNLQLSQNTYGVATAETRQGLKINKIGYPAAGPDAKIKPKYLSCPLVGAVASKILELCH